MPQDALRREPSDAEVGAQVSRARRSCGLSQAAVALATGVSQPRIARIETGARRLTFAQAVVLADLFGVPIDAFVPAEDADKR